MTVVGHLFSGWTDTALLPLILSRFLVANHISVMTLLWNCCQNWCFWAD